MCCSFIQTSETIVSFCSFFKGNKKYLHYHIHGPIHVLNAYHFFFEDKKN